jgi:hypothetical protein
MNYLQALSDLIAGVAVMGILLLLLVVWPQKRRLRKDRGDFAELFNLVIPPLPFTEDQKRIIRPVVRAKLNELREEASDPNPFVLSGSEHPTDAHNDLDRLEKKVNAPQRFARALELARHFGVYSA